MKLFLTNPFYEHLGMCLACSMNTVDGREGPRIEGSPLFHFPDLEKFNFTTCTRVLPI